MCCWSEKKNAGLPWSDPAVMKSYLAKGEVVQVRPNENLKVKVKVQQVAETASK